MWSLARASIPDLLMSKRDPCFDWLPTAADFTKNYPGLRLLAVLDPAGRLGGPLVLQKTASCSVICPADERTSCLIVEGFCAQLNRFLCSMANWSFFTATHLDCTAVAGLFVAALNPLRSFRHLALHILELRSSSFSRFLLICLIRAARRPALNPREVRAQMVLFRCKVMQRVTGARIRRGQRGQGAAGLYLSTGHHSTCHGWHQIATIQQPFDVSFTELVPSAQFTDRFWSASSIFFSPQRSRQKSRGRFGCPCAQGAIQLLIISDCHRKQVIARNHHAANCSGFWHCPRQRHRSICLSGNFALGDHDNAFTSLKRMRCLSSPEQCGQA